MDTDNEPLMFTGELPAVRRVTPRQHCCPHHCLCGSNPNPKSYCDCAPNSQPPKPYLGENRRERRERERRARKGLNSHYNIAAVR